MQAISSASSGAVKAVLADRFHKLAAQLERTRNASAYETIMAADIRRWQQRPDVAIPDPALLFQTLLCNCHQEIRFKHLRKVI